MKEKRMKSIKKRQRPFYSKKYLSIGGVLYPKNEILAIGKVTLNNTLYIYVKTQRTMFYIDFGDDEPCGNYIVDCCIKDFCKELNKFK